MNDIEYGQFFTPEHVVDLIINAIIIRKYQRVLDPGYGEAIFLKRTYTRFQYLYSQTNVSDRIWGNDISPPTESITKKIFKANLVINYNHLKDFNLSVALVYIVLFKNKFNECFLKA